jgi:hypothetical protein
MRQNRERTVFETRQFLQASDHEKLRSARQVSARTIDCVPLFIIGYGF